MSTPEARRWVVSGAVQGVGFRMFVLHEALRLGLAGYVRNMSNGSVEAVARGSAESLAQLEKALRAGPAAARVERVAVSEMEDEAELPEGFEVRG